MREKKLELEDKLSKAGKEIDQTKVALIKLEQTLNESNQEKAKKTKENENYINQIKEFEDEIAKKCVLIQELNDYKTVKNQEAKNLSNIL